ncbi:MAG: hypothetical protein NTW87_32655, partial [Planctomycetota bacterium]|nr:hypothetical protein [Planctomycetota bacterium]
MDTEEMQSRILEFLSSAAYMPMRKRSLARALHVPDEDYRAFRQLLQRMADRNEIAELKRGKYGLLDPRAAGAQWSGETQRRGPGSETVATPPVPAEAEPDDRDLGGDERPVKDAVAPYDSLKRERVAVPKGARVGRIEVKRGGMGFLLSDPPGNDIFVAQEDLGGALSGDLVAVEMKRRRLEGRGRRKSGWGGAGFSRPAGRVVRILERAHPQIVGTFYLSRGDAAPGLAGRVVPDTPGMPEELGVLDGDSGAAGNHDKVVVELVETAETHRSGARPTARVVRVFGRAGDADADIAA